MTVTHIKRLISFNNSCCLDEKQNAEIEKCK